MAKQKGLIKKTTTSRLHFTPWYVATIIAGLIFKPLLITPFVVAPLIELYRKTTNYTVTDERLTSEFSLFNKRSESVGFEAITKVEVNQNMIQRFVGVGDVKIKTFGSDGYSLTFKGILKPYKIESLIYDQMRETRKKTGSFESAKKT
ncbi:hypothetical protein COT72_01740 [archaeon CG10_big_fil_rev_8_21_14_0_10_43_11]|nr:MAG: hypothetical protein COT72_01740 [archaeon CG10_big_fil_rev_8_21_14_0_10_43_11]